MLADEVEHKPHHVEGPVYRVTAYRCDVCRHQSTDPANLARCIGLGRPPSVDEVPVGLIIDRKHPHHGIVLVQVFAGNYGASGHTARGSWWTFRDKVRSDGSRVFAGGDSVGGETCQGPSIHAGWLTTDPDHEANRYAGGISALIDASTPAYRRAYEYLVNNDIAPMAWNKAKGCAVPAPEPTHADA